MYDIRVYTKLTRVDVRVVYTARNINTTVRLFHERIRITIIIIIIIRTRVRIRTGRCVRS